jgi:hypothetical protein
MMSNTDRLEQQLMKFSSATQYPPTPDLAAGFWQRLEATQGQRPTFRFAFAGVALAAVVLAVSATIALASPARDAAADLFHRINIFETSQSTEGLPTNITGTETTLADAERALGPPILKPTSPDDLDVKRVLLQDFGRVKTVAIFYAGDDASFVFFASNSPVGKGIPLGGTVDVELVDNVGDEAFWLIGRRIVQSEEPDGGVIIGSERVTDVNALVWSESGYVYRIEGNLEKDEAIRIAQSVR